EDQVMIVDPVTLLFEELLGTEHIAAIENFDGKIQIKMNKRDFFNEVYGPTKMFRDHEELLIPLPAQYSVIGPAYFANKEQSSSDLRILRRVIKAKDESLVEFEV
ncbi:MAG: hypothetical protein ACRCXZ_00635, partial [Patescibacteria group bacterium]